MNKAHTATANRIARRYGLSVNKQPAEQVGHRDAVDLQGHDERGELAIEVETSATLAEGVARLRNRTGRVYIAVTNKEALIEAVRLTKDTPIGVMDPQGDIVTECAALSFAPCITPPTSREATAREAVAAPVGAPVAIPGGLARGYTEAVPPHAPARKSSEPSHAVPEAKPRAFAIPDAPALSESLPVGFGSDGAGLAAR